MSDQTINRFLARGTAAQRVAFTPSPATPASGPSQCYIWYETDTGDTYAWDGSTWAKVNTNSASSFAPTLQTGRLTVSSGVPVPTTDQTAKSTLYWTPCDGGFQALVHGAISLYNATSIVDKDVTELSLALSGLTSGKYYDVFVDYNSGTPQLVLSAAWTNASTRADALAVQYDSARKVSVIVKSGTAAYRWVGTIGTTGTTTTEDSAQNRLVYNAYNKAVRPIGNNVDTDETQSASAGFADIATVGPSVTFYTGTRVSVAVSATTYKSGGSGNTAGIGVNVSGASTVAAVTEATSASVGASAPETMAAAVNLSGLTQGWNTLKLQYKNDGGTTWHFVTRRLTVVAGDGF